MTADVPDLLVAAAVAAARKAGRDVADVPLAAIAVEAGISRSTLLRKVGGSRRALDDAVRAAGFDPGGRPPVRERAVDEAARLIAADGLAALTMDKVAVATGCSLPSLHEAVGGRDALLATVFDRYVPIPDLQRVVADPADDDPAAVVRSVYRVLVDAFEPEPRVLPALFADAFSRADGPASRAVRRHIPGFLDGLGAWLAGQVAAGRFRQLPVPLLAQLMVAPMALHLLTRPVLAGALGDELPTVDDASATFADAFVRAVSADP